MKKKPEEIQVEGKVLDKDQRKVSRHGTSDHISIPKNRSEPGWKRFLTATVLEINLVQDQDGEDILIITRPKRVVP